MSYQISDRRSVLLGSDGNVITRPEMRRDSLEIEALTGSFQGASQSKDRGYVWLPTLDTKKEVDSYSRLELMKRSRFIYNNGGGLPHRAVEGIARMVCGTGIIPHPTPKKLKGREMQARNWARKVRHKFMTRAGAAKTYDLAQRRNVFQVQRAAISNPMRDGDMGVVLARDSDGRLRRGLYEGHQIGNGIAPAPELKGWYDGVKTDRHNAALAYRLLGWDEFGKEFSADVPAENVLFIANAERLNQVRGLTRFYPIINTVLDRGEIMAALTKGVKIASQVAYVIEQQASNQKLAPGAQGTTLPVRPTQYVETNDGKKVTLEKFLNGGEAWGLGPGQSFKIVQSQNPHPNVKEHLNDIVRGVAWALGYSPEVLWNIIELGGANMRFTQAELQQQIELEQDNIIDAFCGPDYIAWLWDEIEATRDLPDGHDDKIEEIDGWERHVWITPARLTVDFGRDGRLYLEELKRGIRTMQSMYGMRGEEWEIEIDQYLDERQYIIEGIQSRRISTEDGDRPMTFEEAFPEVRQQAMEPAAAAASSQSKANEEVESRLTSMQDTLTEIHQAITFAREPKS